MDDDLLEEINVTLAKATAVLNAINTGAEWLQWNAFVNSGHLINVGFGVNIEATGKLLSMYSEIMDECFIATFFPGVFVLPYSVETFNMVTAEWFLQVQKAAINSAPTQ